MIGIMTEPTPNCFCSAMQTSLDCPTHGAMMRRSLESDQLWRVILREEYDQGRALDRVDIEFVEGDHG
jgi:hypothetical protein